MQAGSELVTDITSEWDRKRGQCIVVGGGGWSSLETCARAQSKNLPSTMPIRMAMMANAA